MRCNRNKLAEVLGRDVKTIDKMVERGMPFVRRPGNPVGSKTWEFDTVAVIGWMRGETPGQKEELRAARTRIAVAEAELRALDYLERLGIVHRIDDILPPWREALINVRGNIFNVPGRVAQLVAYETDEDKVRELLDREFVAAFRPLDDFMAEVDKSAAQSRELLDALASDPVLSILVRARKPKSHPSSD
jgi:phage terminase Nu1 subunit (DNA packaging protein)